MNLKREFCIRKTLLLFLLFIRKGESEFHFRIFCSNGLHEIVVPLGIGSYHKIFLTHIDGQFMGICIQKNRSNFGKRITAFDKAKLNDEIGVGYLVAGMD